MPLLNDDINKPNATEGWFAVRRVIKDRFGKRPDINAILFLIGMNELGIFKEKWEKEEKQDLMHIALCKLFEKEGYYKFTHTDEDGWPHYENLKPMPDILFKDQETLLKEKIVDYFMDKKLI
ncbi:MAG: hypothetical protein KDE33_12890 [Bacteroidetes bacterium]|nr:hypothetical protein [Bacteroidota bacterium]